MSSNCTNVDESVAHCDNSFIKSVEAGVSCVLQARCLRKLPPHAGKDCLSDAFLNARIADLQERLKKKRFIHSLGVAEASYQLADKYGVDKRKAYAAGLLHDWDKNYNDEEIRARVLNLQVCVEPFAYEQMPLLLHGPTAAAALAREYKDFPADVAQAIRVHTTAAVGMTDLDMVVYVADAIEPTRIYGQVDRVRSLVGKVPLEELFCATFQQVLINLVERQKLVYPHTLEVWNYYVDRAGEKRAKSLGKEQRD